MKIGLRWSVSVFLRYAADCAAKNMNMTLVVCPFKQPGDQVAFLWDHFFANRADTLDRCVFIGVTMRTPENMTNPVCFSGKYGRFDLLAAV